MKATFKEDALRRRRWGREIFFGGSSSPTFRTLSLNYFIIQMNLLHSQKYASLKKVTFCRTENNMAATQSLHIAFSLKGTTNEPLEVGM
jgi:hypothetical protein